MKPSQPHFSRSFAISSKKKSAKPSPAFKIIALFIILSGCGVALYFKWPSLETFAIKILSTTMQITPQAALKNNTSQKALPLITALYAKLGELETKPSDIVQIGGKSSASQGGDTLIQINAKIPRGQPFEWVLWNITQCAKETSYRLGDCTSDEKKQSCTLVFDPDKNRGPHVRLTILRSEKYFSETARFAILGEVTTDTNYQTIVSFLSIPESLTVSVVPAKKQSALIAQLAEQYHKEVVIRLPLEPAGKIPNDFPGKVIMVHYSKEVIHKIVVSAQKTIPNFAGFQNLWGSRALEDSRVMGIIGGEIKKAHGYFIETKVTKNSVVPLVSKTMDFPSREIGAVVSEKTKQAALELLLRQYAATAQANGSIIVSVPLTTQSVAAIKASLPWFRQNGIKLVSVSELVLNKEK